MRTDLEVAGNNNVARLWDRPYRNYMEGFIGMPVLGIVAQYTEGILSAGAKLGIVATAADIAVGGYQKFREYRAETRENNQLSVASPRQQG